MKHCCQEMRHYALTKNKLLEYSPEVREFEIVPPPRRHKSTYLILNYCPWCGSKLPNSLNVKWGEIVKHDLGIQYVDAQIWAKLPKKYKTERWWREIGL